MIKIFSVLNRFFCLLLIVHLLATSVCNDYLWKLINKSTIEQSLDIEEDTDNNSKDKTFEFDDEYLVSPLSNFRYNHTSSLQNDLIQSAFRYLQIALTKSNNRIFIPPPRA